MRYSDIDSILQPWAARRSLRIYTQIHGAEARVMNVVDGVGDTYTLYAEPQKKDSNNADNTLAVVAVFLSQRGNKTPSDRERLRFTFEQSVPVSQLAAALDAAWQRTHEWITQAGHSRGNA